MLHKSDYHLLWKVRKGQASMDSVCQLFLFSVVFTVSLSNKFECFHQTSQVHNQILIIGVLEVNRRISSNHIVYRQCWRGARTGHSSWTHSDGRVCKQFITIGWGFRQSSRTRRFLFSPLNRRTCRWCIIRSRGVRRSSGARGQLQRCLLLSGCKIEVSGVDSFSGVLWCWWFSLGSAFEAQEAKFIEFKPMFTGFLLRHLRLTGVCYSF